LCCAALRAVVLMVSMCVRVCLMLSLFVSVGARQKSNKDWGKMSDKDWDRIADEWEDEEEKEEYAYKPPKQKAGLDMEKLQKLKGNQKKMQEMIAESQQTAGPTMMFATVDYDGCCVKAETEKMANRWSSLLYSTGMDAQAYVIEDDQILFSSQHGLHANEIKQFALQQPECVAVEWNQNRVAGPAETEAWKAKNAVKKAAKDAEVAERKTEKEAQDKAAASKAKKKKKKKVKAEL